MFDKQGVWGDRNYKIIKGVYVVFRCGCEAVFHRNGVLYKWLFHCIKIRIEESFGSTLNPRPRAQTAFSSICKCKYSKKIHG